MWDDDPTVMKGNQMETISWEDMSELVQLRTIYSDCHKDAMGCRPRFSITSLSADELRKEIAQFSKMIEIQENERLEDQARAIDDFEQRIHSLMHLGATSRGMAIRWLMESADSLYNKDRDYTCYHFGLPYSYLDKEVIE